MTTIMAAAMDEEPLYLPGDVVWTVYGAGVIVGKQGHQFTLRIWRNIGKSIATAALAWLNPSQIQRKIAAAPGMITTLLEDGNSAKEVLVLAFYAQNDTFLVSYKEEENDDRHQQEDHDSVEPLSVRRRSIACEIAKEIHSIHTKIIHVEASRLKAAPSAKFFPFMETLMIRGDETRHAATSLLTDERTKDMFHKTGTVLQQHVGAFYDTTKNNGQDITMADKLSNVAANLENSVSEQTVHMKDNAKQVIQLVKNKEFTDLLETCRTRLSEIVGNAQVTSLTQKALAQSGIYIDLESMPSSLAESMDTSRRAALSALDKLLKELNVDSSEMEHLQAQVSSTFSQAFDSLSSAAKSDESLNSLFQHVQEQTSEWQEATGRLMATRSASLFIEGANRLQQRAAAIFSQQHFQWAGEIGETLTKSFTEGDAALARLKSIELGDALKDNLVHAIEVRSESIGGLDGIIAGALSQVRDRGAKSGNKIQELLSSLQQGASSATVDAHETLLSILSSQSEYRDVALLQIESVMCALDKQLGEHVSPEDIARIARGEGGTAKLFEPIAKQAMEQIDKQLDLAESNISDATALEVLRKVRRIMSGDLTLGTLMDELVGVLNNDSFVRTSETIVQQSEQVLDLIEGVSGNQAVSDAIKLVKKAGITKNVVMAEIGKLDMSDLLETAGSAVTDERARLKLLSAATDTALDFVLRILPSMPVPPFDGVKDGLIYHISNLSMQGFKVRKENIHIELAGMRATRKHRPSGERNSSLHKTPSEDVIEEVHTHVKATELLIIDIQSISAVLDNAKWSFEQTYMPYLKAQGLANIHFNGGAIRLQFELRKQRKGGGSEWEPVLCLHDRHCSISEVDLNLQGESRIAWIVNKAASIFKGPLRDYIVRTISNILVNRSGWILQHLNGVLSLHWDLIMRTAQLSMNDLVEVDDNVVSKETRMQNQSFIELVWRDQLPLGINLLLNDDSGSLKVVDFPRGSQARAVCEERNVNPDLFKGSRIVAVNGSKYGGDLKDLFAALKEPGRPKTIRFELAEEEEAERVRVFVAGPEKPIESISELAQVEEEEYSLREVRLEANEDLGIAFCRSLDNWLAVKAFVEGEGGIILTAEKSQKVKVDDLLVKVNDSFVTNYQTALQVLEEAMKHRPVTLCFVDAYIHVRDIVKPIDGAGGGDELKLIREEQQIKIAGFVDINGKAERSGIMIGDHLVFINGQPVGAGCKWLDADPLPFSETRQMIEDVNFYPIGLTFARPMRESQGSFRDDEAETICVTAEHPDELGCVISETKARDIIVVDFRSVPGTMQNALSPYSRNLSVQAINGQVVPSYASEEMVKNAINRSWKVDGKVELWLRNDRQKNWIYNLVQNANS